MRSHPPVQCPKLRGWPPRWAEFRGFSLLFDNPDQPPGAAPLACRVGAHPELALYTALAGWVAELGEQPMLERYGLVATPPPSYHVTAWDGINEATLDRLHAPVREAARRWLQALPDAGPLPEPLTEALHARRALSGLLPMRFALRELATPGDIGLVARLMPADDESARRLSLFQLARRTVAVRAAARWGHAYTTALDPHVTLGYFIGPDAARAARPLLEEWTRAARAHVAGATVRFTSIGLYGFTDMAHFHRQADGPDDAAG